jgi:hypothetical protein
MKKFILIIFASIYIISMTTSFAADVETSVTLNGHYIQGERHHLLIDGKVYIVARTLTDALGYDIEWDEESAQVKIVSPEKVVLLTIDQTTAFVNEALYPMEVAPFILNGRTYIPLRMVSEVLGCQVTWDHDTYTVHLIKEDYQVDESQIYHRPYTDEDLLWLARIVEVESDYNSIPMKIGIANVVLNRVKDPRFPNTVYNVIFDDDYAVQFPPAHKSSFSNVTPDHLSILGSKKALEGINNVGESLYFNHRPFMSRADDLHKIIEGEYFYY